MMLSYNKKIHTRVMKISIKELSLYIKIVLFCGGLTVPKKHSIIFFFKVRIVSML